MCWKAPKPQAPPPPAPLPAAAGPPPTPPRAAPPPDPIRPEINPAVRMAKTKKAKNPQLRGTGALRIPLTTGVNSGTAQSGGVNTGGTQ